MINKKLLIIFGSVLLLIGYVMTSCALENTHQSKDTTLPAIETTPTETAISVVGENQGDDLSGDGEMLIPLSDMDVTILSVNESAVLEENGIVGPFQISPDGFWAYAWSTAPGLREPRLISLADLTNIRPIDVPEGSTILDTPIWSPDGEGMAFSDRDISHRFNPLWIENISDGLVQPPVTYDVPFNDIYSIAWSPSGETLYVFGYIPQNNVYRTYVFNRLLELQSTFDIPSTFQFPSAEFQQIVDIYPLENSLLIINNTRTQNNSPQQEPSYTSSIYNFSFYQGDLTLERRLNNTQFIIYCGCSEDNRYLLLRGYNPYDMYADKAENQFLVFDRLNYLVIEQFDFATNYFDTCIEAEDHSSVAFVGENNDFEESLMVWDWNDFSLHYLEGNYYLLGWNRTHNGFTVIDQSQEGIYTIEVISLQ